MNRFVVVVVAAAAAGASVVAAGGAFAGGNSANAHLCQHGGYLGLYRSTGEAFRNAGDCTSYAAQGGTLLPPGADLSISVDDPSADPLTIRVRNDGPFATSATVRFSSLSPGVATGPFLQGYDLPTGWTCVFTGPCGVNWCANCSTSSFDLGGEAVFQPRLHHGWEVEVTAAGENDPDSIPDNNDPDEDDYVLIPGEF